MVAAGWAGTGNMGGGVGALQSGLLLAFALALLLGLRLSLRARRGAARPRAEGRPAKAMVILGSGGHTAEMLALLGGFDLTRYSPRRYVVASTDKMSRARVAAAEEAFAAAGFGGEHSFVVIPRSREVGQSYVTSVATTLRASLSSLVEVLRFRPEVVMCNGPGTGLPVCAAGFLQDLLGLGACRIVYVESMARVTSLSLTGHILYRTRMADAFYVMWPGLLSRFPRAKYLGRVM